MSDSHSPHAREHKPTTQVTMPPAKIVSARVMKEYILSIVTETFGKGSMFVPAMRIETHFDYQVPVVDMVSCNAVRLLLCCEADGSDCSFLTPAVFDDGISRTWFTPFDWTDSDLKSAFNGADKLSMLTADPTDADVYYIIFHDEDGIQKERLVDEAGKRLAREVASPEYRADVILKDKAHAKKSAAPDAIRQSFKTHLHNELLPYFHHLFMKENKEVERDLLVATDLESSLDKGSADIYVAYGAAV